MRHHDKNRKFGRKSGQRAALLRGLARNLIIHGKMQTTEAKAKELRPYIEKLVTKARTDTLATRRHLISRLQSEKAAKKLLTDIGPKYASRSGGYTRIVKTGRREGDASPMAVIEFIQQE